jgi:hypothetical protein
MFTLENLTWLLLGGIIFVYFWHSGKYKSRALKAALECCEQYGLQLLDQSMVIKSIWPKRTEAGNLALRRRYHFEFTSTGAQRYHGAVVLQGMSPSAVELEPYELPVDNQDADS